MIRSPFAVLAFLLACFPAALAEEPVAEPGFKTIFNGKDLDGWDGRPGFWSVQDGHIRGQTSPDKPAPGNTFLIWKGGPQKNFELKLKYRIFEKSNNSGVQYRSKVIREWVVSGYQSEVENNLGKTGFLYHEAGRGWLVDVGDFMEIASDGRKHVVGVTADRKTITTETPYHTDNQWNEYHFICRGNHVMHFLNGYQTVELIDNHVDQANPDSLNQRRMDGVIALQIHGGAPMTVDFKDIRFKELTENYGEARRLFNGKDLSDWEGDAMAAFSVKPLDEGWQSPRQTKVEGAINLIECDGSGGGWITPKGDLPDSYLVRAQFRGIGDRSNGGDSPHKVVQGWHGIEVMVTKGKISAATLDGAPIQPDEDDLRDGRIDLKADTALQYRNIVLIPIAP